MSGANERRLARVADEWAIRDTLARYWRGIDRRDAALVASTYHGYYAGPVAGFIDSLEPGVWAYLLGPFSQSPSRPR